MTLRTNTRASFRCPYALCAGFQKSCSSDQFFCVLGLPAQRLCPALFPRTGKNVSLLAHPLIDILGKSPPKLFCLTLFLQPTQQSGPGTNQSLVRDVNFAFRAFLLTAKDQQSALFICQVSQ